MGLFSRRQDQAGLPSNALRRITEFGRHEIAKCAPEHFGANGGGPAEELRIYEECLKPFLPLWQHDEDLFAKSVRDLVRGADEITVYGASRLIGELLGFGSRHPAYLELVDEGIVFKKRIGLSLRYFTGYETDRWFEVHEPRGR